jgi:hypothetical protein
MSWQRGEQTLSTYPWPLIGVLLVALFLGHDMVMTSEAVAAPRHATSVSHRISRPYTHIDATTPSHSSNPDPAHPLHCSIGLSAIPPNGNEADPADRGHAAVAGVTVTSAPASGRQQPVAWKEPHWPPGTLRAIFQVYRI